MAYINKEESKAIREALKKEFPNSKFGVRIRDNMTLCVEVKKSDLDWTNLFADIDVYHRGSRGLYSLSVDRVREYKPEIYPELTKWIDQNPDKFERHIDIAERIHIFFTPEQNEFLDKVSEIIKTAPFKAGVGKLWFDKSDPMTDYFHTAFYIDIHISEVLNENLKEVVTV